MAKKQIGNTFLGVQEGLTVIKDHCFAFSGALTVSDTDAHKLLSFHAGNYYIVGDFTFWRRSWEDDDIAFYVEMNGTQVLAWIGRQSEPNGANMGIPMVIPPNTLVEGYVDKQQQNYDSIVGMNLTGRVYA
jgi:hypothetical protein